MREESGRASSYFGMCACRVSYRERGRTIGRERGARALRAQAAAAGWHVQSCEPGKLACGVCGVGRADVIEQEL